MGVVSLVICDRIVRTASSKPRSKVLQRSQNFESIVNYFYIEPAGLGRFTLSNDEESELLTEAPNSDRLPASAVFCEGGFEEIAT